MARTGVTAREVTNEVGVGGKDDPKTEAAVHRKPT